MHLSKLKINGFRCFNDYFNIHLSRGLNVIVGENGAGKTAIISAIRQLFIDSESGRYSVSNDDFSFPFKINGEAANSFSIQAEFDELSVSDKVTLLPWIGSNKTAVLNLEAENKEIRGRFRKILWGGKSKSSLFSLSYLN